MPRSRAILGFDTVFPRQAVWRATTVAGVLHGKAPGEAGLLDYRNRRTRGKIKWSDTLRLLSRRGCGFEAITKKAAANRVSPRYPPPKTRNCESPRD